MSKFFFTRSFRVDSWLSFFRCSSSMQSSHSITLSFSLSITLPISSICFSIRCLSFMYYSNILYFYFSSFFTTTAYVVLLFFSPASASVYYFYFFYMWDLHCWMNSSLFAIYASFYYTYYYLLFTYYFARPIKFYFYSKFF